MRMCVSVCARMQVCRCTYASMSMYTHMYICVFVWLCHVCMPLQQKRDLEMAHNELENQVLTAVSELSQCKLKISQVCTLLYCNTTPYYLYSAVV